MFEITENISRPERANSAFPFRDIPVGGGLLVNLTDDEVLDKVAMKVRNAVSSFKKANKTFDLSVHVVNVGQELLIEEDTVLVEEDTILVYRNPDKE